MAQVLVRDLPDEVVERLKAKAAATGSSLEAHLRRVLEAASGLDREEFLAVADAIADGSSDRQQLDSTEIIRASRDQGWS
jgi:plasmid stability protein